MGARHWRNGIVIATAAVLSLARATFGQDVDIALTPAPAFHPVVLWAEYKKELKAISEVRGDAPEIMVDGKLEMVSAYHSRYFPAAGVNFAPGYIALSKMQSGSSQTHMRYMFEKQGEVDGGVIDQYSDFSAVLTPTRDYDDCYVAVLFFNRDFARGESDRLVCDVVFKHLGPLKAAEGKRVNFRFGYLGQSPNALQFFPLVFTHGVEVRTNLSRFSGEFFRHVDLVRHQKLVEAYVAKHVGADHSPQIYQQVAPVFPEDIDRSHWPQEATVSFMVTEDGTVDSVEMETHVPAAVARELRSAIGSWLFLPRLKEGRPTRTMIRVPVTLKSAAPAEK